MGRVYDDEEIALQTLHNINENDAFVELQVQAHEIQQKLADLKKIGVLNKQSGHHVFPWWPDMLFIYGKYEPNN